MKYFGLAVLVLCVGSGESVQQIQDVQDTRHHDDDYSAGKRTFLFGKLVLVPVLAAIGLKFLALLPIVLSKIALLSVMNFLSTNLNLLVSTLFGLKNFLGKHGLWAQEDTKHHPELETFAEYANQPINLPASFRYQYLMDKDSFLTTKSPSIMKVFNGFVPMDTGYKAMAFDRRIRANDRRRYVKAKEQRSGDGTGKYKCYWTNGEGDTGAQYSTSGTVDKRKYIARRKFDIADKPRVKSYDYGQQLDTYAESNNGLLDPPLDIYSPSPSLYDNTPLLQDGNTASNHRQVATHASGAVKINDDEGIRDDLPFTTDSEVKVAENTLAQ